MVNNIYKVKKIKRMSIQYYLVKINNRYFIIDYSDPKKISNYFLGSYSKCITKWMLYEVTDSIDKISLKKNNFFLRNIDIILTTLVLGFVLNGMLFPEAINLVNLTAAVNISEYWKWILLFVALGGILIFILLNIFNEPIKELEKYKKYTLKSNEKNKIWLFYVVAIIFFSLSMLFSLLLGIYGRNYLSLGIFSFLTTYIIIFNRFISFTLEDKYQIIEKEGVFPKTRRLL